MAELEVESFADFLISLRMEPEMFHE